MVSPVAAAPCAGVSAVFCSLDSVPSFFSPLLHATNEKAAATETKSLIWFDFMTFLL
jgi:hypothetical protein